MTLVIYSDNLDTICVRELFKVNNIVSLKHAILILNEFCADLPNQTEAFLDTETRESVASFIKEGDWQIVGLDSADSFLEEPNSFEDTDDCA